MIDLNMREASYQEILSKLVRELDAARWALYEIKSDSETGRIIKVIMFLTTSSPRFDMGTRHIDTS
ncbi:MAG: hypothetical protein ACYC21_05535 [Eubacteriales bacterium]